jgi:hypothetical protein
MQYNNEPVSTHAFCFKIVLKEPKESAIFASWGRLFRLIYYSFFIIEASLAEFFLRNIGRAKLFLRL